MGWQGGERFTHLPLACFLRAAIPPLPVVPQEGHSQVLELLAAVTRDGAISNTFDPMSRVRLGGGGRGMGRKTGGDEEASIWGYVWHNYPTSPTGWVGLGGARENIAMRRG